MVALKRTPSKVLLLVLHVLRPPHVIAIAVRRFLARTHWTGIKRIELRALVEAVHAAANY
jgi:hypothetical protein